MVLPAGVPRFCYGHDTYEPLVSSISRIDLFTSQLHVRSACGHRTTAINPWTCMPFHSTMLVGGDGTRGQSGDSAFAEGGEDAAGGTIVTMYANSSAPWLPSPPPTFAFPNWCTFAGDNATESRKLLAECGI